MINIQLKKSDRIYHLREIRRFSFKALCLWLSGIFLMVGSLAASAAGLPESTHTYLGGLKPNIYNFDVDVRIQKIPGNAKPGSLYYPAIQVNFGKHKEWAHGGVQLVRGKKEVNWGGGSQTGYGKSYDGQEMRIQKPFNWVTGRWYRYRVWRLDKDNTGYYRWLFAIYDYTTKKEVQIGSLRTVSDYINSAVVWTETGWGANGVTCAPGDAIKVDWRNPVYQTSAGKFSPDSGTTSYNGTCTNQIVHSYDPPYWSQETGVNRTTPKGYKLWNVLPNAN